LKHTNVESLQQADTLLQRVLDRQSEVIIREELIQVLLAMHNSMLAYYKWSHGHLHIWMQFTFLLLHTVWTCISYQDVSPSNGPN